MTVDAEKSPHPEVWAEIVRLMFDGSLPPSEVLGRMRDLVNGETGSELE